MTKKILIATLTPVDSDPRPNRTLNLCLELGLDVSVLTYPVKIKDKRVKYLRFYCILFKPQLEL